MFRLLKEWLGIKNNAHERTYKQGFVSAFDYFHLSVYEKLDYHKDRGRKAEYFPFEKSIADMVCDIYFDLLHEANEYEHFSLPDRPSYITKEFQKEWLPKLSPVVLWKNQKQFKLSTNRDSLIKALWITNEEGETVLSCIGDDNVVEWKLDTDREYILEILFKMHQLTSERSQLKWTLKH